MENILGAAFPHPPQNCSIQNNLAEQCVWHTLKLLL